MNAPRQPVWEQLPLPISDGRTPEQERALHIAVLRAKWKALEERARRALRAWREADPEGYAAHENNQRVLKAERRELRKTKAKK